MTAFDQNKKPSGRYHRVGGPVPGSALAKDLPVMAPDHNLSATPLRHHDEHSSDPHRSRAHGWPLFAAAVIVAIVAYAVRYELLPFILAAGIGFVLNPAIEWVQFRLHVRRAWVAAATYILLLALFAAAAYWFGMTLVRDVSQLADQGPVMIQNLIHGILGPNGIELGGQRLTPDDVTKEVRGRLRALVSAGLAAEVLGLGVALLLGVILTLALIPYFLFSGPQIALSALWLVPPERRKAIESLMPKIIPMLRRYLVGVTCVVSYTAIAAYIGFGLIFGLPHAILLSIAVGILEIIPSLGPAASFVLAALAAVEHEHSIGTIALLGAWAVGLRLSIDNIIGPIVLGRAVSVPRIVIMLSFVLGAVLFGIVGLILAVPIAACMKIVLEAYYSEPIAERD